MDELKEQIKALKRGLDYLFIIVALLIAAILALIWIGNVFQLKDLRRQAEKETQYYIIVQSGSEAIWEMEDHMEYNKIAAGLPVAPGATVYQAVKKGGIVRPVTVDSVTIGQRENRCYIDTVFETATGGRLYQRRRLNQLGRSLFLTEAEAVAALDVPVTSEFDV